MLASTAVWRGSGLRYRCRVKLAAGLQLSRDARSGVSAFSQNRPAARAVGELRVVQLGFRQHRHIEVPDHAAHAVFDQLAVINSHGGSIAEFACRGGVVTEKPRPGSWAGPNRSVDASCVERNDGWF